LYPIDYQLKKRVWNYTKILIIRGGAGSCPGGPTEENSTASRVYEIKFIGPFNLGVNLCLGLIF